MIITKEPVIAFVITENKKEDDSIFTNIVPISMNWEGFDESTDIIGKIIGVVPAPQEAYKVYGSKGDEDTLQFLGYEFKGCYHPEWDELVERQQG
ncbi:MAG: hypothetical protein A2W22_01845 [Candidatus Levybacteria bacterium RBG_16_35_11]|nr:MAG: hypothetical protein A2W22_01845 [Candidatus Levybacteria bacterium RBG_16_35_11]